MKKKKKKDIYDVYAEQIKKKKKKSKEQIYEIRLKKIRLRNEVSDIHRITSYTPNTGFIHFFIPGEKPIRIPLKFILQKAIGKHGNAKKKGI